MNKAKKFVVLVCESPYTHQSADTALKFCDALIHRGHIILQVFFYYDGVYVGTALALPEQSERKITADWAEFARSHGIDLRVCSHTAMKRGIVDRTVAEQADLPNFNLNPQFELAGLGQFVEAVSKSDRVISFR